MGKSSRERAKKKKSQATTHWFNLSHISEATVTVNIWLNYPQMITDAYEWGAVKSRDGGQAT